MIKQTIHLFWWLIVPVAALLIQIGLELHCSSQVLSVMLSESGPHEFLQSVVTAIAFIYALWLLTKIDWGTQKLTGIVVAIAAAGTLYITGEEISWGQHILNWDTPEYWAAFNDQNETNLHNTSDWLDQKPRLLLFAGIVVAGVVIPLMRRFCPQKLPMQLNQFYPSNILSVTALGVLIPYIVQEITEQFIRGGAFERVSEVQELYMYYFVLLYLIDLYKREISQA